MYVEPSYIPKILLAQRGDLGRVLVLWKRGGVGLELGGGINPVSSFNHTFG